MAERGLAEQQLPASIVYGKEHTIPLSLQHRERHCWCLLRPRVELDVIVVHVEGLRHSGFTGSRSGP